MYVFHTNTELFWMCSRPSVKLDCLYLALLFEMYVLHRDTCCECEYHYTQSVCKVSLCLFNVTTSSSSRSSQRRGRTPPLRTEHRLAVENLSSRINWQVCATWCLQFVLSPYHQSSEFLHLLVFLWLLSPIGGKSTYVIEMRACNDRIPILPGFYLMFPSATNYLFWSVKVV